MNDDRQVLLDGIDFFTNQRNVLLDAIRLAAMRGEHDSHELLSFVLRMTDAELVRCRKSLDYKDGRISGQEFTQWYRNHLAVMQLRQIVLRSILEDDLSNTPFKAFEQRQRFEKFFQQVKDKLLRHSHDLEQLDAIIEKTNPPAKPEHSEPVVHCGTFPVRYSKQPNIGFVLDANDCVGVLRILHGEIHDMAEQASLDGSEATKEYHRVTSQYADTPESKHFWAWAKMMLAESSSGLEGNKANK